MAYCERANCLLITIHFLHFKLLHWFFAFALNVKSALNVFWCPHVLHMIEIYFITLKNQKTHKKYIGLKSKMILTTFTFNLLFDNQYFIRFDLAERWNNQKQVFPFVFSDDAIF